MPARGEDEDEDEDEDEAVPARVSDEEEKAPRNDEDEDEDDDDEQQTFERMFDDIDDDDDVDDAVTLEDFVDLLEEKEGSMPTTDDPPTLRSFWATDMQENDKTVFLDQVMKNAAKEVRDKGRAREKKAAARRAAAAPDKEAALEQKQREQQEQRVLFEAAIFTSTLDAAAQKAVMVDYEKKLLAQNSLLEEETCNTVTSSLNLLQMLEWKAGSLSDDLAYRSAVLTCLSEVLDARVMFMEPDESTDKAVFLFNRDRQTDFEARSKRIQVLQPEQQQQSKQQEATATSLVIMGAAPPGWVPQKKKKLPKGGGHTTHTHTHKQTAHISTHAAHTRTLTHGSLLTTSMRMSL